MKIYTRYGDQGQTQLLGGKKVSKSLLRIEAYGSVDELNAWVGLMDSQIPKKLSKLLMPLLFEVQSDLFEMGSILAKPRDIALGVPGQDPAVDSQLATYFFNRTELLEKKIDQFEKTLKPLKNFILPGGSQISSQAQVVRAVCRRAERAVVRLHESEAVPVYLLTYLNRLSDFLFVLARFLQSKTSRMPDRIWKSRLSSSSQTSKKS